MGHRGDGSDDRASDRQDHTSHEEGGRTEVRNHAPADDCERPCDPGDQMAEDRRSPDHRPLAGRKASGDQIANAPGNPSDSEGESAGNASNPGDDSLANCLRRLKDRSDQTPSRPCGHPEGACDEGCQRLRGGPNRHHGSPTGGTKGLEEGPDGRADGYCDASSGRPDRDRGSSAGGTKWAAYGRRCLSDGEDPGARRGAYRHDDGPTGAPEGDHGPAGGRLKGSPDGPAGGADAYHESPDAGPHGHQGAAGGRPEWGRHCLSGGPGGDKEPPTERHGGMADRGGGDVGLLPHRPTHPERESGCRPYPSGDAAGEVDSS
jgi:hypothetical protein